MPNSESEEYISGSSDEDEDENELEDEEDEVEEVKPQRKNRVKKPLSVSPTVKKSVKRKTSKTPVKKTSPPIKKMKKDNFVMDLSEPDNTDSVIPEFCCKLGGEWGVKALQYSTHGTPFVSIQKMDEKGLKRFGVQLPFDKVPKLIKGLQEATKHINKHK